MNMLFDYWFNLENLCITQFVDLLQRTRMIVLTIKTKKGTSILGHDSFIGKKEKEA